MLSPMPHPARRLSLGRSRLDVSDRIRAVIVGVAVGAAWFFTCCLVGGAALGAVDFAPGTWSTVGELLLVRVSILGPIVGPAAGITFAFLQHRWRRRTASPSAEQPSSA